MIRRAKIKSLAKINLDLRVLHKRPDGFHELRTVFQTISLADTIDIEYEPARRTNISIDDPLAIPGNLVVKAAQAVLDALKLHARVHFRLRKKIPMGGGLGGGSSNAAAVLMALPVLAGGQVSPEVAAELGSDVPFFLTGGTAVGIGRGTEVYEIPDLKPEPILLVLPGLHVATGPAYKELDSYMGRGLTADDSSSRINEFQAFVRVLATGRSAKAASPFSANDFEAVVFREFPQLQTIERKLSKFGASEGRPGVRMTGSGSTIFAVFGSRTERDRAEAVLKRDRVFGKYLVMPGTLVNRGSYQRLWRRQLRQHMGADQSLWPPQSRYAK